MGELQLDMNKTAVMAMDFQKAIVTGVSMAQERGVVRKAKVVLDAARKAGLPVVHVVLQFREGHPEVSPRNQMFSILKQMGMFVAGRDEAKIDESLGPLKGDIVVTRPRVSAFYNSDLSSILNARGVDTVVLMGISTNWVVEGTARHAADADYRVIVLEDCCAGITQEAHDASVANILSQIAEVSTSEVFLAALC